MYAVKLILIENRRACQRFDEWFGRTFEEFCESNCVWPGQVDAGVHVQVWCHVAPWAVSVCNKAIKPLQVPLSQQNICIVRNGDAGTLAQGTAP